ncbi:MAG: DUF4270 family protein [Ferruginibacter sp.]
MYRRHLPIALVGTFFVFIINWGCTKLDTTTLGSDLLPVVDNIHTFLETIPITSSQGYFADTTEVLPTENHALGRINLDPIFGKTEANMFFQVKPGFYPYFFGNAGDTLIGADSVILCLSYKGSWGDSISPQKLEVREIVDDADFRDSVNKPRNVNYAPPPASLSDMIGAITIAPKDIDDKIVFAHGKDSSTNQIRIKLSDDFKSKLFSRDTTNAFKNDSLFRRSFNGFAVKAVGATSNSLMYISLSDPATRLEVHFRKKNTGTGKVDTVYNSLTVSPGNSFNIAPSGTANNIIRDRTPSPSGMPSSTEHYLQTSPGTFVNISIPDSAFTRNRIIHRAQISIDQVPDPSDVDFTAPPYLYLDLKDTTTVPNWKPIYLDLNPSAFYDPDFKNGFPYFPSTVDYNYFGATPKNKTGPAGQIKSYDINITRYVQQLVTKQTKNYQMRLWAPYNIIYPQYSKATIPYGNPIAFGRVRIGSGSNPGYQMRLTIIYSDVQ